MRWHTIILLLLNRIINIFILWPNFTNALSDKTFEERKKKTLIGQPVEVKVI